MGELRLRHCIFLRSLKNPIIRPCILLIASILLSFLVLNCRASSTQLENRIMNIENGLLKAIRIKSQPSEKLTIVERMRHYKIPGVSIAFIDDYRIEWVRCYGLRERGRSSSITSRTLFQAASISKPITAAAVLHFVEKGVLELDRNVNDRLISWKVPENEYTAHSKVTLRGLLNHSAGVTVHGFNGYAKGRPVPTLIQILDGKEPANSEPIRVGIVPDTQWEYSGGGYTIIQKLLIDVLKMPFPLIMQDTILSPLKMRHSTYDQKLPSDLINLAATGHKPDGKPVPGGWHIFPEMAAAGLWSTPSDIARFAVEIMKSAQGKSARVVSRKMTDQMLSIHHGDYGLGFFLHGHGESLQISHAGGHEGFSCYLVAYPQRGQGVVIMTNAENGMPLYSEILRSIAKEYSWEDFQPKEKVLVEVDPKILDLYLGRYQISPDFIVSIFKKENRLFSQANNDAMLDELFPESDKDFFAIESGYEISFAKDKEGKVTGFTVNSALEKVFARKID